MITVSISKKLLKDFAKVTNDTKKEKSGDYINGTVVVNEFGKFVRLDGNESSVLTPIEEAMDAQNGDRVIVMIKDHKAVVTGNLTAPASARTANAYIKMTDDGLVIGMLNNGEPTNKYLLLSGEAYYIKNDDGDTLAEFRDDKIFLGGSDEAVISFCNDMAIIKRTALEDSTLLDLSVSSEEDEELGTHVESGLSLSVGEDWSLDRARLYAGEMHRGESSDDVSTYVETNVDGIVVINAYSLIDLDSETDVQPRANGSPIVTEATLFTTGRSYVHNGKIASKHNQTFTISSISVPTGYAITGIKRITTNHSTVCALTEFYVVSRDSVSVTFVSSSSVDISDLEIVIDWFALRTG